MTHTKTNHAKRLYTFDLDGVIIVNPFAKGVFPHVYGALADDAAKTFGCTPDETKERLRNVMMDLLRERFRRGRLVEAYDWDAIFAKMAEEVGHEGRFDVEQLVKHYSSQAGYIDYAFPSVPDVLAALKRAGHRVVALTNGFRKYQLPVLEQLGIAHLFDAILTPTELGTAKPDPVFFRRALELSGLNASSASASRQADDSPAEPSFAQVIHVGDSLSHDVWGARRAGLEPVWVVNDLPLPLRDVSPRQRPLHPDFRAFLQERHGQEPAEYWLGGGVSERPSLEECIPAAVVADIDELLEV